MHLSSSSLQTLFSLLLRLWQPQHPLFNALDSARSGSTSFRIRERARTLCAVYIEKEKRREGEKDVCLDRAVQFPFLLLLLLPRKSRFSLLLRTREGNSQRQKKSLKSSSSASLFLERVKKIGHLDGLDPKEPLYNNTSPFPA